MPWCLQCGACPVLLCCLGFFLAFTATAAHTVQEGTPVDISKMLGVVHGKMFAYVYKNDESIILNGPSATCLIIQFLYSQEETNSFGELWAHYKTTDGKRHVKKIELENKKANEHKLGNTLILTFSKSCKKGRYPNKVEFEVQERNLCYVLKATLISECVIIGLITSNSHNHPEDCLSMTERLECKYEVFKVSETHQCLEYEEVTDNTDVKPDIAEFPGDTTPLDERHPLLQSYQNFTQGLLFGTLLLVYSSLEHDPSRLCMITYRPNEGPGPDGKLEILTTFTNDDKFKVQTYSPYTVTGYDTKYATEARIFRNGKFYKTRVIFSDGRRCTILRTKEYSNLCELFTGGRFNNGIVNSYCFFVYLVYCNQPAKIFTKLSDCWPPAKTPNP
uniref:Putative salivary lipocalin n=1 Tax=Ixodes ricinus TaxID=34613 RepID=A0A0K8RDW1_IXORI